MATQTRYLNRWGFWNEYKYQHGTVSNANNAYTNASSNTYATMSSTRVSTTSNVSIQYIAFYFAPFDIPDGSIINNVSLKVKWHATKSEGEFYDGYTPDISLYANSTWVQYVFDSKYLPDSVRTSTLSNIPITTVSQLNSAFLDFYGWTFSNTDTSTALQYFLYGAELTVDYTEPPSFGYANIGGTNKELTGGYVNVNGSWKEISDMYMNVNGIWKPMA